MDADGVWTKWIVYFGTFHVLLWRLPPQTTTRHATHLVQVQGFSLYGIDIDEWMLYWRNHKIVRLKWVSVSNQNDTIQTMSVFNFNNGRCPVFILRRAQPISAIIVATDGPNGRKFNPFPIAFYIFIVFLLNFGCVGGVNDGRWMI